MTLTRRPAAVLALLLAAAAVTLSACGSSSSSGGKQVALVAYSTPQAAYEKLTAGVPGDARKARASSFSQSYGPSGEQSRAVANGLHADLVNFSLEPDVERLVKARHGRGELEPDADARAWSRTRST